MPAVFEILREIEATSKRTDKLRILTEGGVAQSSLRNVLKKVFDPEILFQVTGSPKEDLKYPLINDRELEFDLDTLLQTPRGNQRKDVFDSYVEKYGGWFVRIVNKDLKIGINDKTVLSVFPGLYTPFKCMLCDEYEEGQSLGDEGPLLKDAVVVEPKYDGLRAIYYEGVLRTRNGHAHGNVDHIHEALAPLAERYVLDGELIGADFNESTSIARSTKTKKSGMLTYHIFDIVPLPAWKAQSYNMPYVLRKGIVCKLFESCPSPYIRIVPHITLLEENDLKKYFDKYVQLGYEGVIIKRMQGMYEWKRSKSWLKYKPFKTEEFEIVGTTQLERVHNAKGDMLGTLVVRLPNGNTAEVGTGFTDEMRKTLWQRKDSLVGHFAEVNYQEATKNKKGESSVRFPVFIRIRDFKDK